jgi:hypothetical protein
MNTLIVGHGTIVDQGTGTEVVPVGDRRDEDDR